MKTSLYGLTPPEAENLMKELGAPSFRAKQLLEWMYQKNIQTFDEAKTLPGDLRKKLQTSHTLGSLSLSETRDCGDGESIKYLFKTHDRHFLESVLIAQHDRRTVCVSTQLGCKMGCVFCASGKGKFVRDLTAGEIVEQVAFVQKQVGKLTNVVFMGMGEPLDNFDETMKALQILQSPWGFAMGSRRITVSTSGIVPRIQEFVEKNQGRVRLSVSLHAGNNATRSRLMPINRKYDLSKLAETLRRLHGELSRSITFEYTLIPGLNDSEQDAVEVAQIASPMEAHVNLIPYNPIRELDWKSPDREAMERFKKLLERRRVNVTLRQTAGRVIDAACGQLRLDREKR